MGERHTATTFCLSHINVSTAGSTADDMITPCIAVRDFEAMTVAKGSITIIRYRYPIEMPISPQRSVTFSRGFAVNTNSKARLKMLPAEWHI